MPTALEYIKSLATVTQEPGTGNLIDVPKGPCAWECFIHGTVTKCPFRWVNCDEDGYSPDLDASGL